MRDRLVRSQAGHAARGDPRRHEGGRARRRRTNATRCRNTWPRKFAATLEVKPEEFTRELEPGGEGGGEWARGPDHSDRASRRKWGKIQALYDVGPPPPTHLLVRGSEQSPGRGSSARILARPVRDRMPSGRTSARAMRRDAAGAARRWLAGSPTGVRRRPPCVARVMVNRIWQQLFGRGIVPTPDNFGVQGQPPTHPELLEWLSSRVRRRRLADQAADQAR